MSFDAQAVQVAGANFASLNLGNIIYPITTGLTNAYMMGGDLPTSETSLVSSGSALTAAGSPTVSTDYVQCDQTNNLILPNASNQSFSLCLVAGAPTKNDGTTWGEFLAGNYGHSPTDPQPWWMYHGSTSNTLNCSVSGTALSQSLLNTDKTQFGFYALTVSATAATLYQGFGGVLTSTTATISRTAGSTYAGVLGGAYATIGAGSDRSERISSAAHFNGTTLSGAQIQAIYSALQQVYANRGYSTL